MGNVDDQPAAPIFIIGSPRSGTSILTWCLGQHPNILPCEESDWIGSFALQAAAHHALGSARGERSQLAALGVERGEFLRRFGDTIDRIVISHRRRLEEKSGMAALIDRNQVTSGFAISRSRADPKSRWVDGTPEYAFHTHGLHWLFPCARFIHITRDVDEVVASMLNFRKDDGMPLVEGEEQAYAHWLRAAQACVQAEQALGASVVYRLRFVDLVERGETALTDVLGFLGEAFSSTCLEPLKTRINSSATDDGAPHIPENPGSPIIAEARKLSARLQRSDLRSSVSERVKRRQTEEFEERVRFTQELPEKYRCAVQSLQELQDAKGPKPVKMRTRTGIGQHVLLPILRRRLNWCGLLFALQCALALMVMLSNFDSSTLKGQIDTLWAIVSALLLATYLWMRRAGLKRAISRMFSRAAN